MSDFPLQLVDDVLHLTEEYGFGTSFKDHAENDTIPCVGA